MSEYDTDYEALEMECRRFVQAIENRDEQFIQNHMNKIRRYPISNLFDIDGYNGLRPIHAAIETENVELVKFLSDLYVKGLGGYNQDSTLPLARNKTAGKAQFALQMAFDTGNQEIIQLIWNNHASQEEYEHALTRLIQQGRSEAVCQLMEMGAQNGWKPTQDHLNTVFESYHPEVDEFYAEELGMSPDEVISKQRTELYQKIKARMNGQTAENQNTQILTGQTKSEQSKQVPIEEDVAPLTAKDWERRAELTDDLITVITRKPFNPARAEQLIEQGADVNFKDSIGYTPLHHAVSLGASIEALDFLIEAGADINAVNKQGETPLITATTHNKREIIKYLANHPETDLDCQDKKGNTALHHCVKTAYYKHAKILADAGARSDIPNKEGKTALEMAKETSKTDSSMLKLLNRKPVGKQPIKPQTQQPKGATAFLQEHANPIAEENEAVIRHTLEKTMA